MGLEAALKDEGEGILAWCLEGFARVWARAKAANPDHPERALKLADMPKDCRVALGKYQDDLDIVKQFIDDCLVQDDEQCRDDPKHSGRIPAAWLYPVYEAYCKANGMPAFGHTRFGREIKEPLGEAHKLKSGKVYKGWRIRRDQINDRVRQQWPDSQWSKLKDRAVCDE